MYDFFMFLLDLFSFHPPALFFVATSQPHPAREYVREASIFELPRHIKSYALPLLLEPIVSLHVPDPTIYSSYASYVCARARACVFFLDT